MKDVIAELERMGVPDRYGLVGGLRQRIAAMLVERARAMGVSEFRSAGQRLLEAVLKAAEDEEAGR